MLIPVGGHYSFAPQVVEILVHAGMIHTAFILPVKNRDANFRDYLPFHTDYISVSWGDRVFFLETPTWNEFHLKNALNALFRSRGSVIHIEYLRQKPTGADYYSIKLPLDKYVLLVNYIKESFKLDDQGRPQKIVGHSYSNNDEFYEAEKSFNLFHTCNVWTGDGLKTAGIKTAIWSPFTWGIQYHLNK